LAARKPGTQAARHTMRETLGSLLPRKPGSHHLPSVHTPDEKQSPGAVGTTSERIASATETAVDAADDLPHFLMSAPPRVATVGVNSCLNHSVSCPGERNRAG
jgi:hypothetical protein